MKFIVLILVVIAVKSIFSEITFSDSSLFLRNFNQNNTLYGGALEPQMLFWGNTRLNLSTNGFLSWELTPVVVLPLGNSSYYLNYNNRSDEKIQIETASATAKWSGIADSTIKLSLGRQLWEFGEGHLFSKKSWHPVKQYFDGVNFQYKHNLFAIDLLWAGLEKYQDHYDNDFKKSLTGFYNQFFITDLIKYIQLQFDLYYLFYSSPREDKGDGFVNSLIKTHMYGTRIHLEKYGFFFTYNRIVQQSIVTFFIYSDDKFKNSMSDIKLGFNHELGGVSFDYFFATRNYIPFFGEDHLVIGAMDLFQRRNIKGYSFDIYGSLPWESKLTLKYSIFKKYEGTQDLFRVNGARYVSDRSSSSDNIGQEVDILFNIKIPEQMSFYLNSGCFIPGNYMKDRYKDKKVYQAVMGITAKI